MLIRRFIMEDWLAKYKDTCPYNLGESGLPDITVGELLAKCGEPPEVLASIALKDMDTRGSDRLRAAIAETYQNTITTDCITVTTGTSEALFILFNLLLAERKTAIVPFPSFQALYEVPRAIGASLRFYNLTASNGYQPDPDEICNLIDDSTGVVVLNTPHNPSGVAIKPETVQAIIDKARHHGAMVLADEHYRFLPISGPSPSQSLAEPADNVIATGSITKCFGVIGLRMGWIAAQPELINRICDYRDYLTHTLSPISDYLACCAIEKRDHLLPAILETIRKNISTMDSFIDNSPGWSWINPDGGVVSFPAYGVPIDSVCFAQELAEKFGVFVLPGSAFETEEHVRINLGQPVDVFTKALDIISSYTRTLETI